MKSRRFLLTLLVVGTSLAGSLGTIAAPAHAASFDIASEKGDLPRPIPTPGPRDIAASATHFDIASDKDKKDDPPRPKPKPGPRDGDDD